MKTQAKKARGILPLRASVAERKSLYVDRPSAMDRCCRKFLRVFPGGFQDETYLAWERDYKWEAHQEWESSLARSLFHAMLRRKHFAEICRRAV